jgi:UDP-N-acetylmuramoyl-L-alanyl-D-glutamate--2,6-diaminopimelate ligase
MGKLVVVFGAGGDRDRDKRPKMGRAVSELADVAIEAGESVSCVSWD